MYFVQIDVVFSINEVCRFKWQGKGFRTNTDKKSGLLNWIIEGSVFKYLSLSESLPVLTSDSFCSGPSLVVLSRWVGELCLANTHRWNQFSSTGSSPSTSWRQRLAPSQRGSPAARTRRTYTGQVVNEWLCVLQLWTWPHEFLCLEKLPVTNVHGRNWSEKFNILNVFRSSVYNSGFQRSIFARLTIQKQLKQLIFHSFLKCLNALFGGSTNKVTE